MGKRLKVFWFVSKLFFIIATGCLLLYTLKILILQLFLGNKRLSLTFCGVFNFKHIY